MWFAETIPGANILANVAAKYPVTEFSVHFLRDLPFQLDGEIGNAFAAIYHVSFGDGIGRAGIYAARTGTAIIFYRAIVFQFQVNDKFGNKKEAATFRVYQITVLS